MDSPFQLRVEYDMTESMLIVFVLTSLVVIITPGQDLMLVMSRSIAQGSRAGMATAAGVSVGLLVHTLLAALGLGAMLRSSLFIFTMVKCVGALYLVYLGIRMLRSQQGPLDVEALRVVSLRQSFTQGALSNVSNPKITIFYFAYLPQFLPVGTQYTTVILLLLGSAFALLTFFVKAPIGYGAGALSGWLRARPKVIGRINRVSGLVLIGLGFRLALQRQS